MNPLPTPTPTGAVADYGWREPAPACSQAYLAGPVVHAPRRLGAHKVLVLGCGNGALTHHLQRQGFGVLGCDADARGIELAAAGDTGARFQRLSLYDSPAALEDSGFDAVVSTEVVEHLFEPAALPRFAWEVLKPGGHLIVSTSYHGYLKNLLICLAGKWDSHHWPLRDGWHIKFWSFRTLSLLLEGNGFSVVRFIGAGRLPGLWKSMIVVARKQECSPQALATNEEGAHGA
jgi:SAM-dependent methyltransferase